MNLEEIDTRKILAGIAIIILFVMFFLPSKARFAGSHTVYETRTDPTYGRIKFCQKCHPEIYANITQGTAHNASGCICHGYVPNITVEGTDYDINVNHSLTKNIFCTNCHTRYNSTGDIEVGKDVNLQNQSAHYMFFNYSEKTEIYDRAESYFLSNLETLKSGS